MRLFFAVAIPPELADRIEQTQQELKRLMDSQTIRWVRRDQFHYTVKFLGEQPVPKAQKAAEIAEEICDRTRPFRLTLGGVGAFPNPRRPSVLWIGATGGTDEFVQLAERLDSALARHHFRRETKKPTAHLTVARIKTYEAEAAAAAGLERAQVGELGTMEVREIVLMRSELRPSGSEYFLVERFPFRGGGTDDDATE